MFLIRVSEPAHPTHNAENIVVSGIYAHLGGVFSSDGFVGKDELKGGVVNTREVACARWLMFLRAESKRVDVNASVWVTGVMLVWLDDVEVAAFTFREAVLSVKLEFGSDDWVFAPAMHAESSFGENEGTGVGYETVFARAKGDARRVGVGIVARCGPCRCGGGVFVEVGRTGVDEEVAGIDNTLCVGVGAS